MVTMVGILEKYLFEISKTRITRKYMILESVIIWTASSSSLIFSPHLSDLTK